MRIYQRGVFWLRGLLFGRHPWRWSLKITRTKNGYCLEGSDNEAISIQERDEDELFHHQHLLWEVMEYFNFQGSKHDAERIRVVREKQE